MNWEVGDSAQRREHFKRKGFRREESVLFIFKKKKKTPVTNAARDPILHQTGKEKRKVMEDSASEGPQFLKNFLSELFKDYFHRAASDI